MVGNITYMMVIWLQHLTTHKTLDFVDIYLFLQILCLPGWVSLQQVLEECTHLHFALKNQLDCFKINILP